MASFLVPVHGVLFAFPFLQDITDSQHLFDGILFRVSAEDENTGLYLSLLSTLRRR
jgi:hypothetical protein